MDWQTLIGTMGFPIVACIAMAWYVREQAKINREDTLKLNEQHTQEMMTFKDEIKQALNNNTLALNKLCEKLDREEGEK